MVGAIIFSQLLIAVFNQRKFYEIVFEQEQNRIFQ